MPFLSRYSSPRANLLMVLALAAAPLHAGILVSRADRGFQFTEVVSISVNGKDKVLNSGVNGTVENPIGKLPSVKLGASLYKDRKAGVFVLDSEGSLLYVLPEGIPKGTQVTLSSAWTGATISYKTSSKSVDTIPIPSFTAYLPGGVQELVDLSTTDRLVRLIDSSDKSLDTQLELIAAVAKTFAADPSALALQRYVENSMRTRYEKFESGNAGPEILAQALRFADLSQRAYPQISSQMKLRAETAERKSWLERKVAVLRSFAAGSEWDQFILSDGDFERYEHAFPDLVSLRTTALKTSLDSHRQAGDELLADSEYGAAFRQFRVAGLRRPSDKLL